MTNTTRVSERQEFEFSNDNLKPGDILHLDHDEGHVAIVITEIDDMTGVWGMGTSTDNTWCGYLGSIYFFRPMRVGERTDATFNQTGLTSRLEVVPRRLTLMRNGRQTILLG